MDPSVLDGLDVALNEADLCDCRINERTGEVRLLFVVLTLPEEGPEPPDRRHLLSFTGVSRIVASLRKGGAADRPEEQGLVDRAEGGGEGAAGVVVPLVLEDLPSTVRSFGCQPVYGWSFFDVTDPNRAAWRSQPSIDFTVGQGRGEHSIDVFQVDPRPEEHGRRLDLRLEFDELKVLDARGRTVPLDEFVAGGRRWWAALRAGDPRVQGHGISLPDGSE
jgi:hypothetical protein